MLGRRRSCAARVVLPMLPALGAAFLVAGCGGQAPWLVDIAPSVGLDFTYEIGDVAGYHFPQLSAAGVSMFDYDDDGDLDVYFVNGNRRLPAFEADPTSTDRLFRRQADRDAAPPPNGAAHDVMRGGGRPARRLQ